MWVKIKKYFYIFLSGIVSVLVFLFFRRNKIKKDIKEQEEIIDYQKEKTNKAEKEYEKLVEENNKIKESKEVKDEENIDNSSDAASFIDNVIRKSKSSKSGKD